MTKEIKLNTISWIVIVTLIFTSFYVTETHSTNLFLIISVLSAFKFITIAFQFIEVKHAHIAWKLLSILFITVYLIGCFILL